MINLLRLGFKDFFTAKFIALSILPLCLSIFSLTWLTIWGGGEIFDLLSDSAKNENFAFLEPNSTLSFIAIKILSFSATKWIVSILFYILSTFLTIIVSIVIALVVAGFLTPVVAKEINKRHYNYVLKSEVSTARVLKVNASSRRVLHKEISWDIARLPTSFICTSLKFFHHQRAIFLYLLQTFTDRRWLKHS